MKRVLLAAAAALLLAGVLSGVMATRSDDSRVYSVQQVLAGLRRQPVAWGGRTVRVRGIAITYGIDVARAFALSAPDDRAVGVSPAVRLVPGGPAAWLAQARRIPLLGDLMPRPQVADPWHIAVYRVYLHPLPPGCQRLFTDDCAVGTLVDSAK